jgi:DNA repair protein RecN (Recombination protein N)
MLKEITVKNFALLEDAEVYFAPGFNAITGSTGAGKTLLVSALNFILGARAGAETVRSGASEARVEAAFEFSDASIRGQIGKIAGAEPDGDELILKRILSSDGRTRAYAAGSMVTVAALREIGDLLVDIHSQREHQSLLSRSRQTEALDEYGKSADLRIAFAGKLEELRGIQADLKERAERRVARKRERDFVEFEFRELEALGISPGEEALLDEELKILSAGKRIAELSDSIYRILYDGEPSAAALLKQAAAEVEELSKFAPELAAQAEALENAVLSAKDAALSVRDRISKMTFDENRRVEVEERIGAVERLKKKHGRTGDGLTELLKELGAKLEALDNYDEDTKHLEVEIKKKSAETLALGEKLDAHRKKEAAKFEKRIEKEFADLGMKGAGFKVDFEKSACSGSEKLEAASSLGLGKIEFTIRPNAGEGFHPLKDIASGGELSRAMLAVKTTLADADRTPILVFDEVDAGIGGRMGDVIGAKLSGLSGAHQILCITHLPQIAAKAGAHLVVEKTEKAGKTRTSVRIVSGEERVREIAEMIRGDKTSETTIKQAKEMLGAR